MTIEQLVEQYINDPKKKASNIGEAIEEIMKDVCLYADREGFSTVARFENAHEQAMLELQ